jgi:hypothetical protein
MGIQDLGINALAIIASLSFLCGALLALRWSVLVLAPAIGFALVIVALVGLARGEDAGTLAIDMMVTITCMEAGYIGRLVGYALIDAAGVAITTATRVWVALRERGLTLARSTKASAA